LMWVMLLSHSATTKRKGETMAAALGMTICLLCAAFFSVYIIGCLKMGDEEFQLWLGEKLLTAWRWIARGR